MSFTIYHFTVQRIGVGGALAPVPGSPFPGRIYHVTGGSGQRFENIPEIAKAQRAEVLSLTSLTTPVQIGDVVTVPAVLMPLSEGGALRKIIQVRRYDSSLQCGLQRLPFLPLKCWTPEAKVQRVNNATLKVSDLAYAAAPAVLGYLEPAPDMVKAAAFGRMDLRACTAYTLAPLVLGTVLQDAAGDHWIAELPSDVWPLPGDCKTLMRHVSPTPPGVQ